MAHGSEPDIRALFREVMKAELKRDDPFMDKEDLEELFKYEATKDGPRESIIGYPTRPFTRELGHMFQIWFDTKRCPILDLPVFDLLDEKHYGEIRAAYITTVTSLLEGLGSLWSHFTPEERLFRLREMVVLMGKRGLLDLLGMRKTVGTFDLWPPPLYTLERTFQAKHHDKSQLTVGARALAKHCHRDESSSWWGISTGKEAQKNDHATATMKNIMDNAHWINIHQLPHDVKIVEVRQDQGYGARWSCDGESFRGFLEPQMVDGHEVGWRH